ncbi:ATP11 protein-domain-containing protein [Crepidotus variabilis]|uniref:ATP11 protein-domain-containing protein n=1 Tax=Crepidotus variabilis TaxID=179855 RepID=A0A9P6JKU1_9AGAR|nr:ATP11 protein-domain-containing protein [Crepidotus variabilis]
MWHWQFRILTFMNVHRFVTSSLNASSRRVCSRCAQNKQYLVSFRRSLGSQATSSLGAHDKYAEKLKSRAKEAGLSVDELLKKAEAVKEERRKRDVEELKKEAEKVKAKSGVLEQLEKGKQLEPGSSSTKSKPTSGLGERKDAPPYKELSTILNLQKLFSSPHTAEQISALWTAYHASRSNGTGRGFVCASIPLELFNKMAKNGKQYSSFVVPVPRVQPKSEAVDTVEEETAHEFYYLQWDFHPAPPIPSDNLFTKPSYTTPDGKSNPATTTVLFAPLQEYKLRQSFATPYLVLTMYTELVATHGVVLLRGEITPSSGGGAGYMMSQDDAQLLTMALQRFYLWSEKDSGSQDEGKQLLRTFHEKPEAFKWQDLLKFSSLTI